MDKTSMTLGWLVGRRIAGQRRKKTTTDYLTFASAEPFTVGVNNATKNWDGTLYYSTDAATWNEWDGTTAIASAEHSGEQRIYMRGRGNSVITGRDVKGFVLTGSNIQCKGNIEILLDYVTVSNGEHPAMSVCCYCELFYDCSSLIEAPELPAMTLVSSCYESMFAGCTSLTTAPALPATTLDTWCYGSMFEGCTSLLTVPALPAHNLPNNCYQSMFRGCTGLKFSETQSDEYPNEYRIPTSGEGTVGIWSLLDMFGDTGGTFTGVLKTNTTYYTSNEIV